ncbi:hypothetical protein JKF63_04789 [Porcisia hertigi]|uniref:Uncharacterized protein n=1 Tax=Porcisia hertigi TaxID=2761500 RepID=A0A836IUU7_9TRYP|nr:hypothetical protein JKF63_04789 [Porcisia hertigi]
MSRPFTRITPPHTSTIRRNVSSSVDFPLPVRPTMPTFSRGAIAKLTPRSTSGSPSRYRIYTSSNTTDPASTVCGVVVVGHADSITTLPVASTAVPVRFSSSSTSASSSGMGSCGTSRM